MEWTIDKSSLPKYVRVNASGEPSIDGLLDMWSEVISSEFWRPGFALLLDNRELGQCKDPTALTLSILEFFADNRERFGKACIVSLAVRAIDETHVRMFEYGIKLNGSDVETQVINSETEAKEWLENYCKLRDNMGEPIASST